MNKQHKIKLTNSLIEEIIMAMNDNSYEMEWYLDLEEQKTTFIAEFDEENEDLVEMIEEDSDQERFIPIPRRPSRDGWKQMERFILSLDDLDSTTVNLLHNTIQGSGAFRRFKDAIYTAGIEERWYEFSGREDRAEVLNWLHSLELITEEDIDKGMQLYEEWLAKRKKREKDIENMKTGATVICGDYYGHAGNLTPGKQYKILDEQPQHLNIRLKNDAGNVKWYPKAHFDLIG